MAATPPMGPYVGMTDDEMHAFLKASCGVMSCNIKASSLFSAATCNGVTDVRKRGVVEPSYLPTKAVPAHRPTYLPHPFYAWVS
jgi:hypothetical protein